MGLLSSIKGAFSRREQPDWDDLEADLIRGDLGPKMTMHLIDTLQGMGRKLSAEDVESVCREEILKILPEDRDQLLPFLPGRPKVILVAGVNGTGKTTSTAKLAKHLQDLTYTVTLAAADTFRAAAIEQLEAWAGRIGTDLVKGEYQADASSVCFDAYQRSVSQKTNFLLCDTAGRLHTRHNLMEELKKVARVLGKSDPDSPHERLLVVDATTGSNALAQAREFHKTLDLTGVIVTKLDGSGRGGCIVAIQDELGISARYVGTGEGADDFAPFRREEFVQNLL